MEKNRLSLNDVEWREFRIKDIFETFQGTNGLQTPTGGYIPKKDLISASIPRVTVRETNNGIDSYFFSKHKNFRVYKNFISVSFMGSVFYHPYEASLDMKVHALIPLEFTLTKNLSIFFIRSLLNNTKYYSYGNQLSSTDLANQRLYLPIDFQENLNLTFMESYIKQEQKEIAQKVIKYYEQKILETGFDLVGLEDASWKVFPFDKIFREIQRGKRLKKDDHIEGVTPYVSSTSLNNGVDGFIGNQDNVRMFENNLTLANSGSVGSCFYHQYEYVASDHVTSLTLGNADKYIYLFMATIVRRLEEKYSFNREINDKRIRSEKLILPVDKNGNPHWEYMSQFMKKIEADKLEKALEYIYELAISKALEMSSLEEKEWQEFWLEDIVTISSGVRLTKADQVMGNRPFIGSTDGNNGVTNFISNTNSSLDSNVLGVNYNGSVVENFYHPYEAIFSDDVKRVHWLDKEQEDRYTYLFLKQTILQQKRKYAYGYKFNAGRMKRQKIMLPTREDGVPDYDYMRQYIQIEEIKQSYQIIDYYYNL